MSIAPELTKRSGLPVGFFTPNDGRERYLAWITPDGRVLPVVAGGASPNFIDSVYDGSLDIVADNVSRVDGCSTEPTTYTEATSTYTLFNYTLTEGDGNGDWVVDDGASSGRELNLTAQSGNNGTATGACDYLAFTDTGNTALYGVIDADGDTVNSGSAANIAATIVLTIPDVT